MPFKDKQKERLKKWRESPNGKDSIKRKRDKSKEQRKIWAKEYYKKNKEKIKLQTTEYRKLHPEVVKKTQSKNRDKNILRAKKDRENLKPHYINTLAVKSQKNNKDVIARVLIKRIKKRITSCSDDKVCTKCRELKPKTDFTQCGKDKNGVPHYRTRCNKCYSEVRKTYNINPEKKKNTDKKYYLKNREKIREKQKIRYEQKHNIIKESSI